VGATQYYTATSLDGYIADENNSLDWLFEIDRGADGGEQSPCWVFTHRTLPAVPGADIVFVEGDVAAVHAQMADAAGGKDVWLVGGGDLVGQFARARRSSPASPANGIAVRASRRLPRPAIRTTQVPRAAPQQMKNTRFSSGRHGRRLAPVS
jgi:hypothetical protein